MEPTVTLIFPACSLTVGRRPRPSSAGSESLTELQLLRKWSYQLMYRERCSKLVLRCNLSLLHDMLCLKLNTCCLRLSLSNRSHSVQVITRAPLGDASGLSDRPFPLRSNEEREQRQCPWPCNLYHDYHTLGVVHDVESMPPRVCTTICNMFVIARARFLDIYRSLREDIRASAELSWKIEYRLTPIAKLGHRFIYTPRVPRLHLAHHTQL